MRSFLLVFVGFVLGCEPSTPSSSATTIEALASPSGPRSGEPYLTVDASDRVHMTWIERTSDSTHAVRYARLDGAAWSVPVTIVERGDLFVNWADFPSVVSSSTGRLLVHWLQRSGTGKYAYDVRIAESTDSGRTWGESTVLHRDGKSAEHGFVATWATPDDSIHAAWLDGRHMGPATSDHGSGAMTVHTTSIAAGNALGAELPLDNRNCECCQVNAAVAASGPIVVYRDRSDDEVRDIAIVRRVGGSWTEPQHVYKDNWRISACPVNGPAVAARGDTVVVAWFTGAQDTARVRLAWSLDGGATFAAPLRIDGGAPVGRVDVELLAGGDAIVSWMERVPPETGEVRIRRATASGSLGAHVVLAATSAARPSGFPKFVRRGDELIAAWTVPGDSAHVQMGRLPLSVLP